MSDILLAATGVFAETWFIAMFTVLAVAIVIFVLDVNYKYFGKAVMDFLASLVCIICTSPVFMVMAIWGNKAIKEHGGGRLFTRTLCIGKGGKKMYVRSYALEAFNGEYLGPYADSLKSSHLVNLPRFLDVFAGRLSIIGPKVLPLHDLGYIPEEYDARFSARPGMLSPLAFVGSPEMKYEDVFAAECRYAKKREMFRDTGILFRTLINFTRGENANTQGESRGKDYCEILLERGTITQEDVETAIHDARYGSSGTVLKPTR
ncbi:MAG: sugar transferase [Clostridia bacterium]|nr:sugar transferase [Clostridia bacterium]